MPLFGGSIPYILIPEFLGQPIIALRSDEKHFDHIQQGERASLVVFPLIPKSMSPKDLPLPRLNLTATCRTIVDPELVKSIIDQYGTSISITFSFSSRNTRQTKSEKCLSIFRSDSLTTSHICHVLFPKMQTGVGMDHLIF